MCIRYVFIRYRAQVLARTNYLKVFSRVSQDHLEKVIQRFRIHQTLAHISAELLDNLG